MSHAPERHCKKWEYEEIQYVLGRVKESVLPARIAEEVKRTTGAIVSQLRKIACDSVEKGMSFEDASALTRLPVTDIKDSLERRKIAKQARMSPSEPKLVPVCPPFLKKEETQLDVLMEIRELLRELVKSKPGV